MTPDESRKQKAELLLEISETEQERADLEEKARRTSTCLSAVNHWLEDLLRNPHHQDAISYTAGKTYVSQMGSVEVLTDPRFETAMNFTELKENMRKLGDVRARLKNLQERKSALGLK
jgi:hypothetical protein